MYKNKRTTKKVISFMLVMLMCMTIFSGISIMTASAATTATITNTDPTVKSCIQADNLIPNGDLENGTDFWGGWYGLGWGSPWPSITSSDSHSSSNSLLLGAASWNPNGNSAVVSIQPNTEYTFSFWYKGVDNGGAAFIYQLNFPDWANRISEGDYLSPDSQWRQVAVSFNSGNATSFSMLCWLHDSDTSSYLLLDDMCLFETPVVASPYMIDEIIENVTCETQNNLFPSYTDPYWATAFNGQYIHTEVSNADTHSTSGKCVKYTNWSWNPNSFSPITIEPNTDYTFSVWTKLVDDGSNSLSGLQAYVGNTLIQDANSGISWYITRTDGLWHQYAVSFNSGGATTLNLTLTGEYYGGTNYCELDDFYLFKITDGLPPVTFNTFNVSPDIEKIITNIQPDSTVADFTAPGKTKVAENGATLVFKNAEGTTLGELDKIGSGTTVEVYVCENNISTYTMTIYGDVNGDGSINLDDLIDIRDDILESQPIPDKFTKAGDLYNEGSITLNDLVGVMAHVSENGLINQS